MGPRVSMDRSQLASFCTDDDQISQFENLFKAANSYLGAVDSIAAASLPASTPVALSSGVTSALANFELEAGVWEISGAVSIIPSTSTSIGSLQVGVSLSSGLPTVGVGEPPANGEVRIAAPIPAGQVFGDTAARTFVLPSYRVKLVTKTRLYLVVRASFSVAALSGFGWIQASKLY